MWTVGTRVMGAYPGETGHWECTIRKVHGNGERYTLGSRMLETEMISEALRVSPSGKYEQVRMAETERLRTPFQ